MGAIQRSIDYIRRRCGRQKQPQTVLVLNGRVLDEHDLNSTIQQAIREHDRDLQWALRAGRR